MGRLGVKTRAKMDFKQFWRLEEYCSWSISGLVLKVSLKTMLHLTRVGELPAALQRCAHLLIYLQGMNRNIEGGRNQLHWLIVRIAVAKISFDSFSLLVIVKRFHIFLCTFV